MAAFCSLWMFSAIILLINMDSLVAFSLHGPSPSLSSLFHAPISRQLHTQPTCQQQKHLAFCHHRHLQSLQSRVNLAMKSTATNDVESMKSNIITAIQPTKRGRCASTEAQQSIETMVQALERSFSIDEPARDFRMGGSWEMLYSTVPPPSNGQLGPFVGVIRQEIDLQTKRYQNILTVGPMDWLRVVLVGDWEEWDGTPLKKKNEKQEAELASADDDHAVTMMDYGANCWKVTFKTRTIQFFGMPLSSVDFAGKLGVVLKFTYLDDDTRIVRGGPTGKDEDAWLVYMKRI